jgi:hypothetical protein
LTDLLAAEVEKHLPEDFIRLVIAGTNTSASHQYCSCGDDPHLDWAVHVAEHLKLVVEQHTNGRIAELEAERDAMAAHYVTAIGLRDLERNRAEKAESELRTLSRCTVNSWDDLGPVVVGTVIRDAKETIYELWEDLESPRQYWMTPGDDIAGEPVLPITVLDAPPGRAALEGEQR